PPAPVPTSKRLRKNLVATSPARARPFRPSPRRHSLPVRAAHPARPLVAPRTGGPGRRRDDGSHAGPPQGRLTAGANEDRSPSAHPSLALVFWLTSAINRIVKDRQTSGRRWLYVRGSRSVHWAPSIRLAGASCPMASRPGRSDESATRIT